MRSAAVPIWYLRLVGVANLLTAVSFTLREKVQEHNSGELFTPFMLFAGFPRQPQHCSWP
ncbi:hypothetical protein ABT072_42460 [Streptomyces sp. NPDC002589]|uniref:hypothetical protein n=1 Tax=Streptomyces sp. NPDC002589 TaxID=3154420 RepID=UPI00331CA87F